MRDSKVTVKSKRIVKAREIPTQQSFISTSKHATKFSVIELVLTDRRNLSGTPPNRLVANLLVVDFRPQPREMPSAKPLNT